MKTLIALTFAIMTTTLFAQNIAQKIELDKPNLKRGTSMMETFSTRKSTTEFSSKELSKADLSDLLWAANGVNREDGKRTAPSARNMQEITIYAFMTSGVYIYDFKNHTLNLVVAGDYRKLIESGQAFVMDAPLSLLLVGDTNKLSSFGKDRSVLITAMDAGIVSQNISLFCASIGLANRPRISMDVVKIKELLKLPQGEEPLMNNVVGYNK